MVCPGETITTLLRTVNPNNEPYLTHIENNQMYKMPIWKTELWQRVHYTDTQYKENTAATQKIDKIQTPEITEDHERSQFPRRASKPDTTTINMLTNDILLQYNGGNNEEHWAPPALQMQTIIRTHDNKQYEMRSDISYAIRHYAY